MHPCEPFHSGAP